MPTKEIYPNLLVGFLSADVTSGGTTLNLTTTVGWPSGGNFMVRLDSELMLVTATTVAAPGTLTVTRAQEGTTGAIHTQGTAVVAVLTSGSILRVARQSKNGTSVSARREVNFIEGTNVTLTLADDSTNDKCDVTIAASGGGSGGTYESAWTVPALTDYTWVNQGSATANDDGKGIFLTTPAAAQNNMKLLVIATGSPPWSYVARLAPSNLLPNAGSCGVVWCVGTGGGHQHTLRFLPSNSIDGVEWNSPTSYSGGDFSAITVDIFRWVKVANDGTNIAVSVSVDGTHWVAIKTDYTASYIGSAYDHVGVYVEGGSSVWPASVKLVSSKLN